MPDDPGHGQSGNAPRADEQPGEKPCPGSPLERSRALRTSPASLPFIERIWQERWGLPVITVLGTYMPDDVEGLVLLTAELDVVGLVTWVVRGEQAELVTLDALVEGVGYGSHLLASVEEELHARGVRRISLATTNDNLRALGLYLRQGYRLVRVHLDVMEQVRRTKPTVPAVGLEGIPLQDMWELQRDLTPPEKCTGN